MKKNLPPCFYISIIKALCHVATWGRSKDKNKLVDTSGSCFSNAGTIDLYIDNMQFGQALFFIFF